MRKEYAIHPRVVVEQASRRRGPEPDRWLVTWSIQNLGQEPLQILAGRLPHSRFRGEERELAPIPKLLPSESAQLEFAVACNEPPGTVVENVFLILRVLWRDQIWRLLARFRVVFNEQGAPETITELVTTQMVGFSLQQEES